jgi:uncharacterized protein
MKLYSVLLTMYFLLAFFSNKANAQKLYFSKESYRDTTWTVLSKNIPILAKQLIPGYQEKDNDTRLDNLFRWLLVAEEYKQCIDKIDSIRFLDRANKWEYSKIAHVEFEVYARTMNLQKEQSTNFDNLYQKVIDTVYKSYPGNVQIFFSYFFSGSLDGIKDDFKSVVESLKKIDSDSISVVDAKRLCRNYCTYKTYSESQALGLAFLEKTDSETYIVQDSILIPMKDGGSLNALIVRTRNVSEKQPVVLMYNIYANENDLTDAKYAASKGYVGVELNTRGKKKSKQEIEPFEHDGADAYEAIDWISKQPWCNGKIGMYGGSYLGFAQWSAVKKLHPALKTIVPQVAVGVGVDFPLYNNISSSYVLRWIHFVTNSKLTDYTEFRDIKRWDSLSLKWYTSGTRFRSLDSLDGRPNKIFQRWLQHPSYDSFWNKMVPYQKDFEKINIPVLTTTGYFDSDQRGAMYYFMQHQLYNKNANHYFLIGPYDHSGAQSSPSVEVQGYTIDSMANFYINEMVFEWFDFVLKNRAKPAILVDKVNYQVMGTNTWKHAPSLSKMNNDTLKFYLTSVRRDEHYKLGNIKPIENEYISEEIDFLDRTDGEAIQKNGKLKKIVDTVLRKGNLLSFISEPVKEPYAVNGSFGGELVAMINKKDMDIKIDLYELQPDGNFFNLSQHVFRASYARDRSKRKLLTPGKEERILLTNTFFTSKLIQKGSRLVVVLGMNKTTGRQINYGTGKDVSDETIADGKIPLLVKWSNKSYITVPVYKEGKK